MFYWLHFNIMLALHVTMNEGFSKCKRSTTFNILKALLSAHIACLSCQIIGHLQLVHIYVYKLKRVSLAHVFSFVQIKI